MRSRETILSLSGLNAKGFFQNESLSFKSLQAIAFTLLKTLKAIA